MLIQLNGECMNEITCCSVDWISKFPDECEVLIARSLPSGEREANAVELCVVENELNAHVPISNDDSKNYDHDNDNVNCNNIAVYNSNLQIVSMAPVQTINKSLQFDKHS